MSGGPICHCNQRLLPVDDRHWEVEKRNLPNIFGERSTYSTVHCRACDARWRTDARYVVQLPDRVV